MEALMLSALCALVVAASLAANPSDMLRSLARDGAWHERTLAWRASDPWVAGAAAGALAVAVALPRPDVRELVPGTARVGDRLGDWGALSMRAEVSRGWRTYSDIVGFGTGFGAAAVFVPYEIGGSGAWRRDLGRAGIAFQAVTLNLALTDALKKSVARPRPFTELAPDALQGAGASGAHLADAYYEVDGSGVVTGFRDVDALYSWPSGHTSGVAAGAFAVTSIALFSKVARRPRDYAWYAVPAALTVLEGHARVRAGAHHPSDVITGAVIGAACGVGVPAAHLRRDDAASDVKLVLGADSVTLAGRW